MTTLEDLTTPLTKSEIETAIYDAMAARGVSVTGWKSGAVARVIISGASIVLSAFSDLQQSIAKSGFLELSEGAWLTSVALYVYGVVRDTGSFASGNVEFNNTGGGVFAPGIGDVIASNSSSGKTYRNTAAFTLAALETGKLVPFSAVEIGSDSTSPAGFIDTLETTMLGVTVTNLTALVGADEDTDPELIDKCLAKTGTLSPNGPADAYRFVAFAATLDDGTPVGLTRLTAVPDGEGNVVVYIANASGPVTGTVGDTTTDLGAVDEAIQTQVEPLAVNATTVSAVALVVPVTYVAWVDESIGLTTGQITANVATEVSTFLSSQPIGGSRKAPGGGFVFKQAVEAAITKAIGTDHLIDLLVSVPVTDTVVAATEAPVAGVITPIINRIAL